MKLATIIGARPQFIKAAMVSRAITSYNLNNTLQNNLEPRASNPEPRTSNVERRTLSTPHPLPLTPHPLPITEILIHTGQHYDFNMSDIFFQELNLPKPNYHLGVGSGMHGEQTGKMLQEIERVLIKEQPDMVLVYGDTNSTLAGALASVKLHIPLGHVEAGLRSYNKRMPEEINRVLTDHCSSILFCPTKTAVDNLRKEGFTNIVNNGNLITSNSELQTLNVERRTSNSDPVVINVGDVMYDLILFALPIAEKSHILNRLSLKPKDYMVLTLHRAENVDEPLKLQDLMNFIFKLNSQKIIFPVHPRTKNTLTLLSSLPDNLEIIDPVGYLEMLKLMKHASTILTDSGGVQKEAFWLKVPCITLREETEWVETIESGWNVLYKDYTGNHSPKVDNSNVYGDGRAAERIIKVIGDGLWVIGDRV